MRGFAVWHDEMHGTRHEHHQKDVARRAREERTRTPGYVLLVALLSMFVVFVTPISAFADTINAEVISGPSQVPILDMYGASIAAPDRYTAAALLMGYGPDAISNWDDDVRAKLSNEGTGGNFYTFASDSVQNYFDVTEHTGIFQDFLNFVGGTFWNIAQALYGNNLWAAVYTSEELAAAKADLERVLSGENIGGGGSGGTGGSGVVYTLGWTNTGVTITWSNRYQSYYVEVAGEFCYPNAVDYNNNQFARTVKDVKLRFTNPDVLAKLAEPNMRLYIFGFAGSSLPTIRVLITNDVLNVVKADDSYSGQEWQNDVYTLTQKSGYEYYYNAQYNLVRNYDSDGVYNCDMSLSSWSPGNYTWNVPGGNGTNMFFYAGLASGSPSEPVVPPTNWPEPDVPEPPELPNPYEPVVEPPEPYEPTTGPTFIWNITNTSEPTDTSDLLEWIKKIFYEQKAIHSDLKTWFENLGTAITDGFEAMDNACGQIYDAITENTDEIKNQFQALKTYLKQLFQWLGDKMNFQVSGYDDTSVIYWLKRIWSKLGNGDINVRPTDPTTDPTGVWDWLLKLIQNFLIGLASSANDLISDMADLVSQVMHQFPFSIPWDIAAFLAAFAAAPITPDVDVTIPAIEGWWGETVISIDLSPYDTAAAAVRAMEKILFAAFLAWKSKDLLEFMDVTKWFNG